MYLRNIAFLTVLLLCASGCGQDAPLVDSPTEQLKIEFHLAPGAPAQYDVARIELAVSVPDMDEPLLFSITEIDSEKREVRHLIRVPVGAGMTFSVKAFDGEDCPVLSGSLENVEVIPGENAPKIIGLGPIQILIGIRSEQDRLNVGDTYVLEVYVEDAPKLFAFTCELEFDENLLQPLGIIPGKFFGEEDDVLFMDDSQSPMRQEDRLGPGITRKGDDPGVCGSGTVFHITFRTMGTGNVAVRLLRNDMLALITPAPAFRQIEDSRVLIAPGASLTIE